MTTPWILSSRRLGTGIHIGDQSLYAIREDDDDREFLLRVSLESGDTTFSEFTPTSVIPDGENVGTFAPVPEPARNPFFFLLLALAFRTSGAKR